MTDTDLRKHLALAANLLSLVSLHRNEFCIALFFVVDTSERGQRIIQNQVPSRT